MKVRREGATEEGERGGNRYGQRVDRDGGRKGGKENNSTPTSPQLAHVVGTGASARAPSSPPCRCLCPRFDIVIHGEIIARDARQLSRSCAEIRATNRASR